MEKTSYLIKRFNQTVMMEHPDSHIIECYGYLASERLLLVKILDNALYAYENVSPVIFRQMQLAASKGKFFLREIRDYYNFRRMGPNEYKIGLSQTVTEPVANTLSPVWPEFQTQVPDCWL